MQFDIDQNCNTILMDILRESNAGIFPLVYNQVYTVHWAHALAFTLINILVQSILT